MSSLFKWAVTLPFIVIVVGFSALHADEVTLRLEPLAENITLPLFVPIIAFVFIGFIWGALINWLNTAPLRQKSRQQNKEIKSLKKEIAELHEQKKDALTKPANGSAGAFDLLPAAKPKSIDQGDIL